MKAIILLFDSLNKHYLPPYGDMITQAPNFQLPTPGRTLYDVQQQLCWQHALYASPSRIAHRST